MSDTGTRAGPLAAIVAEGFVSRLSFGIISFALPLYAHDLGMGLGQIGLLLSFNTAVALVLKLPMAALSDRVGHRPILIAAMTMRSVVSLLLVIAVSPLHLFAIRGLHGLSIAMRDPATGALIAIHGGKDRIASSFAWYQTMKSLAGSFGKGAAGIVLGLTAANFSSTFGIAAVLSALPIWVVVRYVHDTPGSARPARRSAAASGEQRQRRAPRADRPAAHGPAPNDDVVAPPVLAVAVFGMLVTGTAYMMGSLFPVLAVDYAGLTESQTGLILLLAAGATLTGPAFGRLSDDVSHRLVLSLRSIANVGSSALYLLAPSFAGFAAARVSDDIGKAAFKPAWGALIAKISSFDPRRRARIMSKASLGEDAGEIAGPVVAGLLWSTWGVVALFGVRIGLAVVTEIYAVILARRLDSPSSPRRRPPPPSPRRRLPPSSPRRRLPPSSPRRRVAPASPPNGRPARSERSRILLIERDPWVSSVVAGRLQSTDWQVVVADDEAVGRFLAATETFDVVVLDLDTIDTDGLALLTELRQADRGRPVVAVASNDDVGMRQQCRYAGASTVLSRPLRLPELRTEIGRLVEHANG